MGSSSGPAGPRHTALPPELMPDYGWLRLPPVALPPPSAWKRWGRNLALFLLTAASVFWVGAFTDGHSFSVSAGVRLALGMLSILAAHEMGHYVAARLHRVDATLPFFVPLPLPWISFVGTLGAFIRIRSRFPHRRALFDIGVAGPLAGFVVAIPVLWLGLLEAAVQPPSGENISLGTPLLFAWLADWVRGPIPDGYGLTLGPLGRAAWFGLLVTALNLMPIGQLDGGHVSYSLFRERAHRISHVASWVCVALIYFGLSWILWALLVRLLGRRHPATLDDQAPIGRARVVVGVLSLIVFVLCFVPEPIVFSWRELLQETPLGRFLQ